MNNNQHTTSYYAASAGQIPDYPALTGSHKADVCVIGAGFSGISTALHLAERGYKVHVVEANRVGWGASGRNGGQLIGGISGEGKMANKAGPGGERLLWELRWAGHDIIRERVNTYDIDCDLKWGYLDVAFKPRHLRDQLEERENLERYQFPHEYRLLSKEETQEIIGTEAYIGALLNMGNGHLHPLKLCLGEARAAQSLGVEIWEQSPVVRIDRGSPATVVTAQGSVSADHVVLAGNAYHLLEPALRNHIIPVNSFIIATEPLSDEQVQACNPKDLAVCDPNFILQYYRLSADKRLLFGGRCNYFGEDPEHIKAMMRPKMERIYPRLKGIKIDYAWGGTIGVTANRVPQLGKLANNIYFSQGYSGHGVNVTHLAGRTMAEAVAGTSETLDVFSAVKPFTVPGIRRWQKTLVSLGMLYYSIKDRL
jgi:glycine/D-amino acid oxidase-like deaminating enzyme